MTKRELPAAILSSRWLRSMLDDSESPEPMVAAKQASFKTSVQEGERQAILATLKKLNEDKAETAKLIGYEQTVRAVPPVDLSKGAEQVRK